VGLANKLAVQTKRVEAADATEQKRGRDKASPCGNCGGGEMAAGGRSGEPWRARSRTTGQKTEPARGEDDAWVGEE
jgi:hypothetical protein